MHQFKIRENGFKEIKKALLIKAIPIGILAALGGVAISHFGSNGQQKDVNALLLSIPVILGALGFGLYRGINRQKEIFESYILTIDSNGITREQHNTQKINISRSEVSKIIKNPKGSFTIQGNSTVNVIGIPAQIENHGQLEQLLSEIMDISPRTNTATLQKLKGLLSLVTMGLMAAVFISMNKLIVGISGTLLLLFLVYSFFEIQRSKNVDSKTKKGMWMMLLVAASVVGVMYFKLTRQQ